MNKRELLAWLHNQHDDWLAVIAQCAPERWVEPGAVGYWSMKDVLAHLIGWNCKLVAGMRTVQEGEEAVTPPWPAGSETEDEINAWFYETNRDRSVSDLMKDEQDVFEEVLAIMEAFPEDVEIETVHHEGRDYYLIHWNDQRLQPGEFFDHFHDDHEAEIRAWLAENS